MNKDCDKNIDKIRRVMRNECSKICTITNLNFAISVSTDVQQKTIDIIYPIIELFENFTEENYESD